jgi:hypothetical protein
MKPTSDDFAPRRDGWFEHRGVWGEVTRGTVIASRKRTERWEIVDVAHGQQVEYGHTLWMRAREQSTGAEYTVDPRPKTAQVTILTQSPLDTQTPEITPASDAEVIALLVEELGALHLATRDNVTGEIHCPNYDIGANHLDEIGNGSLTRGLLEHLRFAHKIDPDEFEVLDWEDKMNQAFTAHGRAHNPRYPNIGKGGFPHRHVPEDLSLL